MNQKHSTYNNNNNIIIIIIRKDVVKLCQFSYRNIKWNKSPCESNKILSSWSHTIHDLILTCSNDSNRLCYWYLFIINTTMDNNNTVCFCSFQGIFYCFMILIVTKRAEFTVFNWQQFSFTGHGSDLQIIASCVGIALNSVQIKGRANFTGPFESLKCPATKLGWEGFKDLGNTLNA